MPHPPRSKKPQPSPHRESAASNSRPAAAASAAPEFPDGLDFEVRAMEDGEWMVWTPAFDGRTGACIGSGVTEHHAKLNASRNLEIAIDAILGRDARALNPTSRELFAAMSRAGAFHVAAVNGEPPHFRVTDVAGRELLFTKSWCQVLMFLGLWKPSPPSLPSPPSRETSPP